MRTYLPTMTLATILGLSTLGETGLRQRPVSPATTLTTMERVCQEYGLTAEMLAHGRDQGLPYLTLVSRLREHVRSTGLDPAMTQLTITTARIIYDSPAITAAMARQIAEMQCVRLSAPQEVGRVPSMAKDRY